MNLSDVFLPQLWYDPRDQPVSSWLTTEKCMFIFIFFFFFNLFSGAGLRSSAWQVHFFAAIGGCAQSLALFGDNNPSGWEEGCWHTVIVQWWSGILRWANVLDFLACVDVLRCYLVRPLLFRWINTREAEWLLFLISLYNKLIVIRSLAYSLGLMHIPWCSTLVIL